MILSYLQSAQTERKSLLMRGQLLATTDEVLCQQNCIYTQETFSRDQNLILHFILFFSAGVSYSVLSLVCTFALFCQFSSSQLFSSYIFPDVSLCIFSLTLKKTKPFFLTLLCFIRERFLYKKDYYMNTGYIFSITQEDITLRSQVTFSIEIHK